MLEIKNLHVSVEEQEILKGLSLQIEKGQIHALMGPNGAGKSTLAKVLAGHPSYEITSGEILFHGKDLLEMEPDERSHAGLFLGFQYPVEIPGLSNELFLRTAYNSHQKARKLKELSKEEFTALLESTMKKINMQLKFKERNVNEGFSGGEKKRNEILQMAILQPKCAILDETDSGLDIDALRIVADGINQLMHQEMGIVLITHYQRLLNYIQPNFVHVMIDGVIVESGGPELAHKLEEQGYDWITSPCGEAL